jgi:short subunit dehydrogenase-like uncharacterized protein
MTRKYDLVLMGATGFTGKLVAQYLLHRYGLDGELRWAIAGRNREKLDDVCGELGEDIPVLLADSADQNSLLEMAQASKVVCSTVGPYALYGSGLVEACSQSGTHYCDLTGEVQWMRRMIDTHQATAQDSGARIVHNCGFDCIPSDLGCWFLQQAMLREHGVAASHIKYRVEDVRGAMSGGTLASAINMLEETARDPALKKIVDDPYALLPAGAPRGPDGPDQTRAVFDKDFGGWTIPFPMAPINTRVVRRSHALMGLPWGENFAYDEAILLGGNKGRLVAGLAAAATQAGNGFMAIKPLRNAAKRWLPQPGEGPSQRQREKGYFKILLHARHPQDPGKSLRARVSGDMDPGYGSTAKMLGESAACLALDQFECAGGLWTPASAMAEPLLERLQKYAGLSFELLE